jgi:hypothetical protein
MADNRLMAAPQGGFDIMASARFSGDIFDDFDIEHPGFNEKFHEILDELISKCRVHSRVK